MTVLTFPRFCSVRIVLGLAIVGLCYGFASPAFGQRGLRKPPPGRSADCRAGQARRDGGQRQRQVGRAGYFRPCAGTDRRQRDTPRHHLDGLDAIDCDDTG